MDRLHVKKVHSCYSMQFSRCALRFYLNDYLYDIFMFYRTQDGLIIPPGWLCYLAPELMRSLKVHIKPDDEHLPFSKASDVYAFGYAKLKIYSNK